MPTGKTPPPILLLLPLLAALLVVASGQAAARPKPPGFLAPLQADQFVNLKDTGAGYEIHVFEHAPGVLGHTIVEVAVDHVVVEDVAGVTRTRIPLHAIKSVVVTGAGRPAERR